LEHPVYLYYSTCALEVGGIILQNSSVILYLDYT